VCVCVCVICNNKFERAYITTRKCAVFLCAAFIFIPIFNTLSDMKLNFSFDINSTSLDERACARAQWNSICLILCVMSVCVSLILCVRGNTNQV
jgi:hypothetical protein